MPPGTGPSCRMSRQGSTGSSGATASISGTMASPLVTCSFGAMKVAYVFSTSGHTASYKLGKMILPQLENGTHGVDVVGMFFFDDNNYVLREGDPLGERLSKVAADSGMLLMMCDQCAIERGLAEGEPMNATQGHGRRRHGRLLPRPLQGTVGQPARPGDHAVGR